MHNTSKLLDESLVERLEKVVLKKIVYALGTILLVIEVVEVQSELTQDELSGDDTAVKLGHNSSEDTRIGIKHAAVNVVTRSVFRLERR